VYRTIQSNRSRFCTFQDGCHLHLYSLLLDSKGLKALNNNECLNENPYVASNTNFLLFSNPKQKLSIYIYIYIYIYILNSILGDFKRYAVVEMTFESYVFKVFLLTNSPSLLHNFHSYDGRILCVVELRSIVGPQSIPGVIQECVCNIAEMIFT
jgi:hypothetical protein